MDLDKIRLYSFRAHALLVFPLRPICMTSPNQRFGNLQRCVVIMSHNELVLSDGKHPFLHILYDIQYIIELGFISRTRI